MSGSEDENKGKKAREVEWFIECNPFTNESVERVLADLGISDAESKMVGVPGSDGKLHDVLRIPARFANKLRDAKRGDARHKLRFFKRDGAHGVIRPADFLEQPRTTKKFRKAEESLQNLREKQTEKKRKR